jgi:RAB protein geranylgeranyltransferase component A
MQIQGINDSNFSIAVLGTDFSGSILDVMVACHGCRALFFDKKEYFEVNSRESATSQNTMHEGTALNNYLESNNLPSKPSGDNHFSVKQFEYF